MYRLALAAAALAVTATAGTIATAGTAASDPCDNVPAAQDQLRIATSQWQVASASYDIANAHGLPQRYRLFEDVKRERLQYAQAIADYDAARDACAR